MTFRSVLLSRPSVMAQMSRPSLTLFFLLAGAFLLTLVPHVIQFPIWLTAAVIGAIILRAFIEFYRLPLPSIAFTSIMAFLLLGCVLWQFQRLSGREAGTALTAGLLAIKFYELRRPRDAALIIFSCFFMVMSALLYSQVLELFVYCLIMMWVLTALLLRVHTGDQPSDRLLRMLRRSGIIFLQALPLAAIFFFFFPRYTGKLSFNLDQSTIGLSATVSPGSIAQLAENNSEAMYVQFKSHRAPPADTMYWRAMVLWDYKDGAWTAGKLADMDARRAPAVPEGSEVTQEITVFAHNERWLFALDVPISVPINKLGTPGWARFLNDDVVQLANSAKLDHTERYDIVSSLKRGDQELTSVERGAAISLPQDEIDKRVKDLADRLHQGLSPDQQEEYVLNVLRYFREGNFIYSTDPGPQGADWLTYFLFRSRTGFCEHFASAFAILMRLEGIPARLIVGYEGGDYNPYADHYIVSQSDAHAWDEVYLDSKKHWVRIDPTAAILPMSEEGTTGGKPSGPDNLSRQINEHRASFYDSLLPDWAKDAMKEMRMRRDEVEANWDNLVFAYDPSTQNRLAQALGMGATASFDLAAGCLAAAVICLVIFRQWMNHRPPVSPIENLYDTFCRNMARRGIPRAIWEGPLAYTQRLSEAFPDESPAFERVGTLVSRARYGAVPVDPATPHELSAVLKLLTASQAAAAAPAKVPAP
jgi:transglutaminase-like putative cysteine protease